MRTGWVSSAGRFIDEFEEKWAAYCGRRYGVAVSNGTTALQIAVGCLDLEPGDEVIMPTFTIISCALAVVYNGGIPVLVDSDPARGAWMSSRSRSKITPRTRAIMPVHIYGHPVDMDAVSRLAEQARPGDHRRRCGSARRRVSFRESWRTIRPGGVAGASATVSCFSFYANKLITTGEGGHAA